MPVVFETANCPRGGSHVAVVDGDEVYCQNCLEPGVDAMTAKKSAVVKKSAKKPAKKAAAKKSKPKGKTLVEVFSDEPAPAENAPIVNAAFGEPKNEMSLLSAAALVAKDYPDGAKVGLLYEQVLARKLWTPKKGCTPKATLAAAIITEIGRLGPQARFKKIARGLFAGV